MLGSIGLNATRQQEFHLRIRVAVQAEEINLQLGGSRGIASLGGLQGSLAIQGKTGTEGILVGVEEDVRPIIFVVTDSLARRYR